MNAENPDQTASPNSPSDRQPDAPRVTTILGDIINQQLQVMARQLEVLRGMPSGSGLTVSAAQEPRQIGNSEPAPPSALPAHEANAELSEATGEASTAPCVHHETITSKSGHHAFKDDSPLIMPWTEESGFGVPNIHAEIMAEHITSPTISDGPPESERDAAARKDFGELPAVPKQIEAVLNTYPEVMFSRVLIQNDGSNGPRIIAYIVERNEIETDKVDEVGYWHGVWEGMHHSSIVEAGTGGDPTHAFLRSIQIENPEDQERQFTFQTVDRIRALGATSVYEIGCGTGGLVRALHPHCQRYWASDFAESAVTYLRKQLSGTDGSLPEGVALFQRAADDFSGIEPESFDLVLIHSVVQYFPDVAYLLRVIDGAIRVTRPGGCIYLGAIQNLASYEAYHTNLQAQRAPADLPVSELRKRVRRRLNSGEEFTIDPGFFRVLSRQNSRIRGVDIRLRRGDYYNKSTKFLYDAILYVGEKPASIHVNEWRPLGNAGIPEIRQLLETHQPETMGFHSLLNARLRGEIDRFRSIVAADPNTPLRQIPPVENAKADSIDPEHLWKLGEALGYQVHVNWAADGNPSCMDAVFTRHAGIVDFPMAEGFDSARGLAAYVSEPHSRMGHQSQPSARTMPSEEASRMREYLRTRLPANMIPDAFVAVSEIPLSSDGAINPNLLPESAS